MTALCEAVEFLGCHMACGRCGMSWDGIQPERWPACKPKADPPITLAEMIVVARNLADAVIASQTACVAAGFRAEPYMPQLRQAAVLRATMQLLERVRDDKRVIEMLKG